MIELLILGAIVGFFANGMYGGYGAIINYLYPIDIVATANSFIMNIGKFIGSFSTVVIGFLMSKLSMEGVMAFSFNHVLDQLRHHDVPSRLKDHDKGITCK